MMQNNTVNNYGAIDKLSFVMCSAAYYSLIYIDNYINVVLNNLCGLGEHAKQCSQ